MCSGSRSFFSMFQIRCSRVVTQNIVKVEGEQNLGSHVDFEKQVLARIPEGYAAKRRMSYRLSQKEKLQNHFTPDVRHTGRKSYRRN